MGEPAARDAGEATNSIASQGGPPEERTYAGGGQPSNTTHPSATMSSTTTSGNGANPDNDASRNPRKRSPGKSLDSPPIDTRASVKKVKVDGHDASRPSQPSARDSLPVPDKSLLSPEIWHHIFTFCPPRSLGTLLRVNKLFNTYLDASSSLHRKLPLSASPSSLSPLKPGAIWQASRRLFWPQMPAPLRSMDELAMWRLICTPRCQSCQKPVPKASWAVSPPQPPSPGPDGIAIIWAFAMHLCVICLLQKSIKELDVLVSPSIPSAILPALPFVFLTGTLHILPIATLDQDSPPSDIQVTKLFLRSDVDLLERHFSEVKDMGHGTVDEWLKGLSGQGKKLRQQALKWAKWEASGGVVKMLTLLYPGWQEGLQGPQPPSLSASSTAQPPASTNPTCLRATLPLPPPPQRRSDRSAEKVAELKASRKAEIERRALQLDPPLTANVLRHIPAFQAAIQITTSLDDQAWEVLKPRLLAQRHDAEFQESSVSAEASTPAGAIAEPTPANAKEARELVDKNWEEVQAPLRAKIASYADDIIGDSWQRGRIVKKANCGRFAVDVLVHVRKRFYAEVAKLAKAARAAGQSPPADPPAGPFTQKLTLENMRWLFNTKVRPYTDSHSKDMFYCAGCKKDNHKDKVFGFEGIIQHYASKHTSSLSLGSIVVHWRAEWPEDPPFSGERPVHGLPLAPLSNAVVPPMALFSQPFPPAPMAAPAHPFARGFGAPQPGDFHHHPPAQAYQPPVTFPPYAQPVPYLNPQGPFQQYQLPPGPYGPDPANPASVYGTSQEGAYPPIYGFQPIPPAAPTFPVPGLGAQPNSHQAKLEDIARNARFVWMALGNITDLPGSARVYITIHHVVKRYRGRFHETPPLAMFNDGLANITEMRPVRNINKLVCKACHLRLDESAPGDQDRKSYSLPQLTNHFLSKHVQPRQSRNLEPLDWIVDMVLLPDQASMHHLASSLRDFERSLVSDALPGLFGHQATPNSNVHPSQMASSRQLPATQDQSLPSARDEEKHQPHSLPPRPPAPITLPKKPAASTELPRDSAAGALKPSQASNGRLEGKPANNNGVHRPPSAKDAIWGAGGVKKVSKSGRRNLESDGAAYNKPERYAVPERNLDNTLEDTRPLHEAQAQPVRRSPSPRWMPPQEEEPNVMSALERQLGLAPASGPQRPPSGLHYADTGSHTLSRVAYPHYPPDSNDPSGSYRPARDSPPRQTRQSHVPRPTPYADYHPPPEEIIPPPRFVADRRYEGAAHVTRPEDEREVRYDRQETYRPPPRQTVEAYEIVQVIEGDREYYIRRPVRREQTEVRYVAAQQRWKEQERAEDGGGYYAAPPPREVLYRREQEPQQQPQQVRQEAGRVYYEEYDPRFPGA